ncbi:uncharacterized protein PFLUO_LOCUS685 [Penicillium psychrofluorescens]|uniref:uncharacterized protein n=1 Tax=Penicillium psychrofluorescens TaxID=3158075 RepID=UPI003CCE4995
MRLAHLHLPNISSFTRVSDLQKTLTTRLLTHKKLSSPGSISSQEHAHPPASPPPPDPTVITFTPNPVYTTGRRDLPPSNTTPSSAAIPKTATSKKLSLPPSLEPIRSLLTPPTSANKNNSNSHDHVHDSPRAEYHPTLRGGQTTYHGPGQMVAYTILDLKRLGLTPRCHIRVLENSVIDLLAGYGVKGFVTEDPGVWVHDSASAGDQDQEPAKKITAVGVHLRRNISSFGVGLNVTNEPMWFFRQIVACGLEGREVTSLAGLGVNGVGVDEVASAFVRCFVDRVNRDFACTSSGGGLGEKIEEVYPVTEEDLLDS